MISGKKISLFIGMMLCPCSLYVGQKKTSINVQQKKNINTSKKNIQQRSSSNQHRNQLPPIDLQLFKNLEHNFSQLNQKDKETNFDKYRKDMQSVIDTIYQIGESIKTHSITKQQNNRLRDILKKSVGTMTRQESLTYNHVA